MKRLLALALMVLLSLESGVAEAQSSMAKGFGKMTLQSARNGKGLSRVEFANGLRAERFELLSGDCPKSTGDCTSDRERIEFFDSRPKAKPGSEYWYAYSVFLPGDFPIPRAGRGTVVLTLGQIHQRGTSGPELLFHLDQQGFWVKLTDPYRLDDDPMNPVPVFKRDRIASAATPIGKWMHVKVQARWSRSDADGFINVWINGKPVWSHRGATTNANDPLYFKYGLYRAFVSRCGGPCPGMVAYYANVRQGRRESDVE